MADEMSIKIENVSKSYTLGKTHIPALKHISLEIEPEDFLVIAGPSGSGKTTLLNLIGLIDKPSSGRVLFGDRDVTQTSLNGLHGFRRDRLGYIFQGFNLISVLSVYENVEYPLILKNMSRKERKEKVDAVLERVGLADRKKHKPNQLYRLPVNCRALVDHCSQSVSRADFLHSHRVFLN